MGWLPEGLAAALAEFQKLTEPHPWAHAVWLMPTVLLGAWLLGKFFERVRRWPRHSARGQSEAKAHIGGCADRAVYLAQRCHSRSSRLPMDQVQQACCSTLLRSILMQPQSTECNAAVAGLGSLSSTACRVLSVSPVVQASVFVRRVLAGSM